MDAINLTDLKQEFESLVDRLDAGDSVDILRDGKPFARLTPTPPLPLREPFDFGALKTLVDSLPFDPTSAGDLVRRMRDDARY